jgi:hypothetical protein
MADSQAVNLHFESNNLSFYSFFSKSERPIKAVIRHLSINTPAEDIAEGLEDLGFEVTVFRQLYPGQPNPKNCLNCPTSATSPSR